MRVLWDIAHRKYGVTPPCTNKKEEKPITLSVTVPVTKPVSVTGPVTSPNTRRFPVTVTGKNNPSVPVTGMDSLRDPVTVTGILARLADECWWRWHYTKSMAENLHPAQSESSSNPVVTVRKCGVSGTCHDQPSTGKQLKI